VRRRRGEGGPEGLRGDRGRPERVAWWLAAASWPKPDLAEFHLKLVAASASGLAVPARLGARQPVHEALHDEGT
jgi:hypothetical protein